MICPLHSLLSLWRSAIIGGVAMTTVQVLWDLLDSGSSTVSPLLPFKDSCEMLEVAIIYLFILTLLEQ